MNPAIIINVISVLTGVSAIGLTGIYFGAPHLLGIYYDVEIYVGSNSTITIQTNDAPQAPVVKTPTTKEQQTTNEKNMLCSIEGETSQTPFECSIFDLTSTTKISVKTKKYINKNNFEPKQIDDISKITTTTETSAAGDYYKIVVSEQLLWELQKTENNTKKISIKQKHDSKNNTTKTLAPFLYYSGTTASEIKINSSVPKYYVGQAKEIIPNNETTNTEITKGSDNKYKCSYTEKGNLKECNIHNLQSGTTETLNLTDITFSKNTDNASTIKKDNFYLIKVDDFKHDFYIQETPTTENTKKTIKMKNLGQSFIVSEGSTNTLFHFPKN